MLQVFVCAAKLALFKPLQKGNYVVSIVETLQFGYLVLNYFPADLVLGRYFYCELLKHCDAVVHV